MTHQSWCGMALAAMAASPVWAGGFDLYTDRPTFEAALSGPYVVEDCGPSERFPITTGVLNSQTSLVPASGVPILPGDIAAGGGFEGGCLDGFHGGDASCRLTVTFDAPASAFGIDTNELASNLEVVVCFSDHSSLSHTTVVSSGMSFYGFRSQNGGHIVSATIGGPNNGTFTFALDNFTSTAAPVPEPGTAAPLLIGQATLGRRVRRRA